MQSVRMIESGEMLRICIYTRGKRGDSRKAKRIKSKWKKEAWKKLNYQRCVDKLLDRVRCNFQRGDWHAVLTLSPEHETKDYERLRYYWRHFVQRLRRLRKKQGHKSPVYVYVLEGLHGDKRLHIHALFQAEEGMREAVAQCWGFGFAQFIGIETLEHRDEIAKYIAKEPVKLGKHQYTASLNCAKPRRYPVYTIADGERIAIPEGYAVVSQSEQYENDVGTFQYLLCRRIGA